MTTALRSIDGKAFKDETGCSSDIFDSLGNKGKEAVFMLVSSGENLDMDKKYKLNKFLQKKLEESFDDKTFRIRYEDNAENENKALTTYDTYDTYDTEEDVDSTSITIVIETTGSENPDHWTLIETATANGTSESFLYEIIDEGTSTAHLKLAVTFECLDEWFGISNETIIMEGLSNIMADFAIVYGGEGMPEVLSLQDLYPSNLNATNTYELLSDRIVYTLDNIDIFLYWTDPGRFVDVADPTFNVRYYVLARSRLSNFSTFIRSTAENSVIFELWRGRYIEIEPVSTDDFVLTHDDSNHDISVEVLDSPNVLPSAGTINIKFHDSRFEDIEYLEITSQNIHRNTQNNVVVTFTLSETWIQSMHNVLVSGLINMISTNISEMVLTLDSTQYNFTTNADIYNHIFFYLYKHEIA